MRHHTDINKCMATHGWRFVSFVLLLSLAILGLSPAAAKESADIYHSYLPLMVGQQAYYVATSGSDTTGNGSSEQPWATINHALTAVSDGSSILVRPGTYTGQIDLRRQFNTGVTIRSEVPYQAQLRNNDTVLICFYCRHITIEGFDISHSGPGAGRYIIQIQDVRDDGIGGHDLTFRNNVLHDSTNNDILKINNGAGRISIEGNIFYNQSGLDSHIDLTSVTDITVQDNIFFNDLASNHNNTGSFIIIKDVNGNEDGILGSHNIFLRRNIFLNWQGKVGNAYIGLGDTSSTNYHHAYNVWIENSLFLGNANNVIHAPLKIVAARDVVFRNNTIANDLPSKSFAFRLDTNGMPNENIQFYNNIWSDPTGTMGSEGPGDPNNFAESDGTLSFALVSNLYWNGGQAIPSQPSDPIRYTDDPQAVLNDPVLPVATSIDLPRWESANGRFADNSSTIREVFTKLVLSYGTLANNSPAIDQANPTFSPAEDILGHPRQSGIPDIGAYEFPSP